MTQDEAAPKPRKPRCDSGPRLIDRDIAALRWIAQQCAIRLDHLCILLARLTPTGEYVKTPKEAGRLTEKRVMTIVRRWEAFGLIEKKWMLVGEPPWFWLTPEGLRLVSDELGHLRSAAPTPSTINHLYHCNHARLLIEQRRPDVAWTSDRQLRAGMKIESGQNRPHRPDAVVVANEKQIALEVELTVKSSARLITLMRALASEEYVMVWYFTTSRSTHAVSQAIASLAETERAKFQVYNLDDMPLKGEEEVHEAPTATNA